MDINEIILRDNEVDALNNGTWVGDIPELPGVRLLVRGLGTRIVQAAIDAEHVKLRKAARGKPLDRMDTDDATRIALAKSALLGWEGFTQNGEPLPYSPELALQWLSSPKGAKFADIVANVSRSLQEDPAKFVEAAAKN